MHILLKWEQRVAFFQETYSNAEKCLTICIWKYVEIKFKFIHDALYIFVDSGMMSVVARIAEHIDSGTRSNY